MRRGLLLALLVLSPPLAPAQERELYWEEIRVEARLDGAGVLHVTETQTLVLTGDWNGGERRFRGDWGEDLDFDRLLHLDPGGREVALTRGDLDEVDHYASSNDLVRWRIRRPDDPPFRETRKVYRLEFTMRGVLRPTSDGTYKLLYEFVDPIRPGPIRRFVLDLSLDPSWQVLGPLPAHIEQRDLAPGKNFVLPLEVSWLGVGKPAAVPHPLPWKTGVTVWAVVLLGVFPVLLFRLFRREQKLGRIASPAVAGQWDERHLRRELFSFQPEEVAALWGRHQGPSDRVPVLERLAAEGKRLTSADLLPASAPHPWGPLLVLAAALACFARDLVAFRLVAFPVVLAAVVLGGLLYAPAAAAARRWRDRIERPGLGTVWFLVPVLLFTLSIVAIALFSLPGSPAYPGAGAGLGLPLLAVAFLWSVTHWAMSREGAGVTALRKRLAGLRSLLRQELAKSEPRVREEWGPYLTALGLERKGGSGKESI